MNTVKSKVTGRKGMLIALAFATLMFAAARGIAQSQQGYSAYDKGTPAENKSGLAGLSTYAHEKIETVNLANGNLSVNIPLVSIGGRGSVAYTLALSYNSKLWSGHNEVELVQDHFDQLVFIRLDHFAAMYNIGPGRRPNQVLLGGGWSILKAPAIKVEKVEINPIANQPEKRGFQYTLTRVWFIAPDGSEIELRDDATDGAPSQNTQLDSSGRMISQDRNRGRVWHSTDGSAITYITDDSNGVVNGLLSGSVFLSDGTRLEMSGMQLGGGSRCKKIIDRNGNVLQIDYDTPSTGDVTYTDQLGREVVLDPSSDGTNATIRIKGYQGVAQREMTINTGTVVPVSGNPVNLRADYWSIQRPFISGDYFYNSQGEIEHSMSEPHTDLFVGADGKASDQFAGITDMSDQRVVTQLNLLDGRTFRFRYNPYGELAEVIYPAGGRTEIDYDGFFSDICDGGGGLRAELNRKVTTRRSYDDGTTQSATWNYSWSNNPSNQTATVEVRQGAGGALLMSQTHHFLALNAEYRQCTLSMSNGTGFERWENAKEWKVVRQTGGLPQTEERVWEQRAAVSWAGFTNYAQEQPANDTRMIREDVTLENGKMKRTEYGYDQYNNVTSMIERDFGTAASPGPIVRRTNRTFATTINGYCYTGLNGPSGSCTGVAASDNDRIHQRRLMLTETIQDVSFNQEARTEIEYDIYTGANHAPVEVNANMVKYNSNRFGSYNSSFQPRGNVTMVRRWIVGSTYVTSFNHYDEAGNVVKAIDGRGFATTISYTDNYGDGSNPDSATFTPAGPTYAMGTSVTNAKGHVAKMQWDYGRGSATGVKDANGVVTKTEYNDPFDRPTRVTTGFGLTGSETAISEMSYPTASLNEMKSSRQLDSTRWLSSKVQYDGFGRAVLASQSEDGLHHTSASWSIHVQTKYDGLGRAVKATNPYRSASASTDGWTRTSYDVAGRVVEVASFGGGPTNPPPDSGTAGTGYSGSVVTTYNGEVTTVRDQAGKQRRSTVDGLGRLKTVEEMMEWPSAVVYATTNYSYDARGNLKQVNQSSQTPRTFSYDGLSRLTSANNPESGAVSYSYDANSNLQTKTDARPVTTTYTYDELNRVTLRNYSDTTADVSYVYDPPIANGKGRLASVTSSVSAYNYTAYDAQGRVTQYNQQTSGELYLMGASYNKGGLMLTESYPSGKVIETQYDSAGRIAGMKKQGASTFIAGGGSSDAANRLQYTASGAVSAIKLGNGLWEHTNFNSRLQPTQIGLGTTSTTSGVLQLDYGYGTTTNNGNVMSQAITAPGISVAQTYSYDQVNRLSSATESAASGQTWQQVYGYDVYGNRWVTSGYKPNPTLTPQSQSAFNSANNQLTTASGYNYDAVGNLTKDPTTAAGAMGYDAENRQTSYTKAGVTTSYGYDGDGRRVKKVDSTGTTVFVYNAGGQLIAEYGGSGGSGSVQMSYLTADHLGSTRLVTDGSGAVKARRDYLPFGEEIETSIGGRSGVSGYTAVDSTRQRFTSKERDQESGLDYFLARYYSSAQGRFTSPDPFEIVMGAEDEGEALAFLSDPRSWNKYAYTYNNPIRFVDPDGQRPQDSFHNRLDKAVRDQGAGKISEQQYWEIMRGGAVGGAAGLAVVGVVAGGKAMAASILLWAARNPDKVQQIAQEMAQASTGSPAPAPRLGTPLSKIFGVSDDVIASGSFIQGKLGDALIGGQFTKSGDKLTAGIIGAYANDSPLGVLHKLVNSIKDFARAQGAKTVELQAIAVINKDLEKALIKQGFQKTTVLVDGQKVEAYVKTIQLQ